MKLHFRLYTVVWTFLLLAALISCTSDPGKSVPLASFNENDVDVSISLVPEPNGGYALSAIFVPPEGYHLYSKDIPLMGVDGLGRPTLLELTSKSRIRATGPLRESILPRSPDFEPRELLIYPTGAVTLSLPIELPAGDGWRDDEISVTYMACNAIKCKPPAVGRIVPVQIPGRDIMEIE